MSSSQELNQLAQLGDDELCDALAQYPNLPRHVAIIMDGNGRWAKKRFLPRVAGHRAGRHAVRRCVETCGRLGIGYLTLYTFSQENFGRPEAEVKALWHFLQESLIAERDDLQRRNVRLVASGDLEQLPEPARRGLQEVIASLAGNTGLTLNLALAYGGRQEILSATRRLAAKVAQGELELDQIDEATFAQQLYSPEVPDPDLLIRTSGEGRLSNFLLWQSAYAEFLFTPVLWPDFKERDLLQALLDYLGRERRFGALSETSDALDGSDPESVFDAARWKRLLKVRS
jgi:undecaprenyl diphosphate synthase|nr:polyprenyl diphosphate synthase [Candidatus Krumholzibacteria bacterium]